jgi:hypothetical protein
LKGRLRRAAIILKEKQDYLTRGMAMGIRKDESGGIVLEAAIVLPLFMSFILVLIAIVQLTMFQINLKSVVTETTKDISSYIYVVSIITKHPQLKEAVIQYKDISSILRSADNLIASGFEMMNKDYASFKKNQATELIPTEIKELLTKGKDVKNNAAKAYMDKFVIDQYSLIDSKNLSVTKVDLPDVVDSTSTNPYLGIEVQYKVRLYIPFFTRDVVLREKSYERVWVSY